MHSNIFRMANLGLEINLNWISDVQITKWIRARVCVPVNEDRIQPGKEHCFNFKLLSLVCDDTVNHMRKIPCMKMIENKCSITKRSTDN